MLARRGSIRLIRAELRVFSLDAVLTWLLVVTLDLALTAWPTGGPVANFAVRVDDATGLLRCQIIDWHLVVRVIVNHDWI